MIFKRRYLLCLFFAMLCCRTVSAFEPKNNPKAEPAAVQCAAEPKAVINEIASSIATQGAFIEVKRLATSPDELVNWTLTLCDSATERRGQCYSSPVSQLAQNAPESLWLYVNSTTGISISGALGAIDFGKEFSVWLKDSSGTIIDFFSVIERKGNVTASGCEASSLYDLNSGTKFIERNPDGGVNWTKQQSNNEISTQGGTNDAVSIITVNHYELRGLQPNGLTCQAMPLTLYACNDALCTAPVSSTSVTLTADGGATLSPSAININNPSSLNLSKLEPGDSTISIQTANPDAPLICKDNANCSVSFSDAGLVFNQIPGQVSGKPSNLEYQAATLAIKALKKGDDFSQTGRCENALAPNTTVSLDLRYQCLSNGLCNNNGPYFDAGNEVPLTTDYTAVNVNLDDQSAINYVLNTPSVGDFILIATLESVANVALDKTLVGISNAFLVKPFGLRLTAQQDAIYGNAGIGANSANSPIYTQAGKEFVIQAEPIAWRAGQDSDLDGHYDKGMDITANVAIGGFDRGKIDLAHQKRLPVGGDTVAGTLSYVSDRLNGSSSNVTASWSEVGIIDLEGTLINDGEALPWGETIKGYVSSLGRFVPSHFDVEVTQQGLLQGQCTAFTYTGARVDSSAGSNGALMYMLNPQIRMQAMNKAGGITQNYQGDFNKLTASSFSVIEPVQDNEGTRVMALEATLNDGELAPLNGTAFGQFTYTLSNQDHFRHTRDANAKIAPFISNFELAFDKILDGDNITIAATKVLPVLKPIGHEIRFGRASLSNSYGPEDSPIDVPLQFQYWDGSKFVVNQQHCGSYALADLSLTPLVDGKFGDITPGTFDSTPLFSIAGYGQLSLPASNQLGEAQATLTVPSWLQYNWSGAADYNELPFATVHFGRFRGNDRVINWREVR